MGSDNALKDGTRAQLHSISLSRGRCGRAALLPAVSLLLMLVAVHFWCDCIPSLDLAEGKFAFLFRPPIIELKLASSLEAAALAGLSVTRECERMAFFGHMGGHATQDVAVDKRDGGWAFCITEKVKKKIRANSCIAYSFGISNDISFDLSADAVGCVVRAFDHTIQGLPIVADQSIKHNIDYHHVGLGTSSQAQNPDANLTSLAQIMADHKHEEIDYLKIDIEGHEWAVLEELLTQTNSPLFKVDQLCLEIHFAVNEGTHSVERSEIGTLNTLARHFDMFWRDENFRLCRRHLWLPGALGYSIRKCHNICYLRRNATHS